MLDKDMKLIVKNYGTSKVDAWQDIYRISIDKEHSPQARDMAMNSQIEAPRCVPDSSTTSFQKKIKTNRNRSVGLKRRQSSVGRKLDVSAYKNY